MMHANKKCGSLKMGYQVKKITLRSKNLSWVPKQLGAKHTSLFAMVFIVTVKDS